MTPSQLLYSKLREIGLDFFISVPCKNLAELIDIASHDKEITYTPVTREEEGMGVAVGAWLGGKKPVILMQNSGIGNSINAICSLVKLYQVPVFMVISHRGTEGELIDAQVPMGDATKGLLKAAGVRYTVEIHSPLQLTLKGRQDVVAYCAREVYTWRPQPVALLFPIKFWKG